MIIDRVGSLTNEILTDKTTGRTHRGSSNDPAQGTAAHATLSSVPVSVDSLVTQTMRTPSVRQEKIDALRASVANGTYSIDNEETASVLLSQEIR